MAKQTPIELRKQFLYQVYIRNHTKEGTFKAFCGDLDRIADLGVDTLHLLPIHPIGVKEKKGSLGCPYSISDFRGINPEYGTLEDFKNLLDEAHKRGLKVIIDVVYNHTSHDSVMLAEHPEWFFRRNGELAGRVGDWSDITDLDYTKEGLWDELIDILVYWTKVGVDGFRCDVASIVPIDFWLKAREACDKVNPNMIWLSESVHGGFLKYIRDCGFDCHSESEIFQAFDMAYDYDTHDEFLRYVKGEAPLSEYIKAVWLQEVTYPKNYVKMRNLENHDQPRFASFVTDMNEMLNWVAFMFFQKGSALIYGGQENLDTNLPSLFDKDLVNWDKGDISPFIKKMAKIAKEDIFVSGVYNIEQPHENKDVAYLRYEQGNEMYVGLFNFKAGTGNTANIKTHLPDGAYENLTNGETVEVVDGVVAIGENPIIVKSIK